MVKPTFYNRVIFLLGLAGFLVAGYVLQGYLRQSSVFCPVGGGCEVVRKSPYAWPLGIPVPSVGFVGYAAIIVLAFLRTLQPQNDQKLLLGLVGMSTFGALFVTGFSLTQAFLIHRFCSWCVISTVLMYLIFGLVVASFRLSKSKNDKQ